MVRLLLKAGADVNAQDKLGAFAGHLPPCKGGNPPTVKISTGLSHGGGAVEAIALRDVCVSWDATASTGSTPLHRACSAGKVDAARALVEEGGAKLELRDRQGQTPLLVAASCGHQSVALYLIARGADVAVCTFDWHRCSRRLG